MILSCSRDGQSRVQDDDADIRETRVADDVT